MESYQNGKFDFKNLSSDDLQSAKDDLEHQIGFSSRPENLEEYRRSRDSEKSGFSLDSIMYSVKEFFGHSKKNEFLASYKKMHRLYSEYTARVEKVNAKLDDLEEKFLESSLKSQQAGEYLELCIMQYKDAVQQRDDAYSTLEDATLNKSSNAAYEARMKAFECSRRVRALYADGERGRQKYDTEKSRSYAYEQEVHRLGEFSKQIIQQQMSFEMKLSSYDTIKDIDISSTKDSFIELYEQLGIQVQQMDKLLLGDNKDNVYQLDDNFRIDRSQNNIDDPLIAEWNNLKKHK